MLLGAVGFSQVAALIFHVTAGLSDALLQLAV